MADEMEVDGPSYLLPTELYDATATTTTRTTTSQQQPPSSGARKRTFDAFAEDLAQTTQSDQTVGSIPPSRSGGMFTSIYESTRSVIASIWGYFARADNKEIVAIQTGHKRRAIEADISPSKLTAKLPGSYPVVQESDLKFETLPAAQLETPPDSRPTSSQEQNKKHDSPMAGQEPPQVSPRENTNKTPKGEVKTPKEEIKTTKEDTKTTPEEMNTPEILTSQGLRAFKKAQQPSGPSSSTRAERIAQATWLYPQQKKLGNTVVGRLPPPSFNLRGTTKKAAETSKINVSPTFIKNAQRDAEVDALIEKTKRTLMVKPEQAKLRDHLMRCRMFHDVDPDSYAAIRVNREIGEEQERLYAEAEEAKLQAEYAAKRAKDKAEKEAKTARLKAEQEAIEQKLHEEAAKQAELAEEEKKQEELRKALEQKAKLSDPEYIKKQQLIRPLDSEWDSKVDAQMAVKSRNHVVTKTVDGTDLTRKDFGTLLPQEGSEDDPNGWLNDEIVNGWMSTIVSRKLETTGYVKSNTNVPAYAAMTSAWYSNYQKPGGMQNIARWSRRKGIKGEKLLKCEKVFFPINTGNHWLLLIISPKDRSMELLDSLSESSKQWFLIAREWLALELGDKYNADEWTELRSKSSKQKNMNDCGVFTCFNALAAAKDKDFAEVGKGDMKHARRLLGAVLLNGGFFGDYEL